MIKLSKREYIIIGIMAAGMILYMIGDHLLVRPQKPTMELYQEDPTVESDDTEIAFDESEQEKEEFIMVDICGAVQNSGVVKLKEGDRIIDAVELVGGLLPTADRRQVNLARVLVDGEQVYIPEVGEIEYTADEEVNRLNPSISNGKININNATQTELESLNGIGNVLAERIIQYRNEKGKFKTTEEIKKVSGIGDKKFEGIKDSIIVN